jgi:hypothetical protein
MKKDTFNNVEYVQIKKNNKQLMYLDDKEINGMTRTELAKLIGLELGEGVFHYTIKYFKDPKITVGKISSIMIKGKNPIPQQPDMSEFYAQIKKLDAKIEQQASGSVNVQAIMEMKDAAYKIQIDFWKSQTELLRAENEKLKREVEATGGGNNNLLELLAPAIVQMLTKQPA